jgi:hypothetical protein
MIVYFILVAAGTIGSLYVFSDLHFRIHLFDIMGIFIFFSVLGYVWWTFCGKFKEPFIFPWEK